MTTNRRDNQNDRNDRDDRGFTLVELLIVIVILGILATVTVFAVRGITDRGRTNACASERRSVSTAIESYFAQYGSGPIAHTTVTAASQTTAAPFGPYGTLVAPLPSGVTWALGTTPGDTLVNAGFLRSAPTLYIVRDTGQLVYTSTGNGATCIPTGVSSGALVT